MSVQYRAVWQDDRSDLIDTGRAVFQEWITMTRNINLTVPVEGTAKDDMNEIRVTGVSEGDIKALRICLDELITRKGQEQKWTTIALWMTKGNYGWTWVDLEFESSDIAYQPHIYAPKLVANLLALRDTSKGYQHLGPQPLRISSEKDIDSLIDSLYDQDRSVPIIVYSVDKYLTANEYNERVERVASRLAGCADIRMLTNDTQDIYHNWMDHIGMSVFEGAARIYLPGIDKYDPKPWMHRYIRSHYLSDDPQRASERVVKRILPRMVAHRPPEIYDTKIRQLLSGQDWEEIAISIDKDNQALNNRIGDLEMERDIAHAEESRMARKVYKLSKTLDIMKKQLRELGKSPDIIEQQEEEKIVPPSSCAEAIEHAKQLKHISIHPNAPQRIEVLDQQELSERWGIQIFKHLQSLDAYSREKGIGFTGSFREWCKHSGNEHIISSLNIAMKESESVRNNQSLMAKRYLPIDKAVDSTGRILMEAHLKPTRGGGMQIPRIYFHDDTKGNTGKVHIGFIGPHDLMPNPSAN